MNPEYRSFRPRHQVDQLVAPIGDVQISLIGHVSVGPVAMDWRPVDAFMGQGGGTHVAHDNLVTAPGQFLHHVDN